MLREIAADEGRHAAHGWDVVLWCLHEGGEPVAVALRGAMAVLPRTTTSSLATGAHDGSWERYGLPSAAREEGEYERAVQNLAAGVEALLAEALQRAA